MFKKEIMAYLENYKLKNNYFPKQEKKFLNKNRSMKTN